MTVRRGLLYVGVFLVAAGGVTLLVSAGVLDPTRVADALAWWPLAFIAIGAGLVLRHTRAAVPGGVVAAAVAGLMLGAVFVAVPDLPTPCTNGATTHGTPLAREGAFGSTARVSLALSCGELDVTMAPGSAWSLGGTNGRNRTADISSSDDRLAVSSSVDRSRWGWNAGADDWDVTLPAATQLDLDVEVNAGKGSLDLAGGHLDTLGLDLNAGAVTVDLDEAVLSRLAVTVNAGASTVHLPSASDVTGDLEVNAGSLQVCVPDGTDVQVRSEAALGSIDIEGLVRRGDAWTASATSPTQAHADLTVSASVGSVTITSEGACK
ncbi:MAG TPA: hypothetical protein VKB30_06930 [Candidatus Limnocylindrales bacterium]|nr:hypothetical protein [Candidatus Limnocylindrales bacterium]